MREEKLRHPTCRIGHPLRLSETEEFVTITCGAYRCKISHRISENHRTTQFIQHQTTDVVPSPFDTPHLRHLHTSGLSRHTWEGFDEHDALGGQDSTKQDGVELNPAASSKLIESIHNGVGRTPS